MRLERQPAARRPRPVDYVGPECDPDHVHSPFIGPAKPLVSASPLLATVRAGCPPMNRRNGGFTLMELMVVLAIAATIVGLGAPSFNRFRLNARLTNSANDVLASLTTSRTESIKSQVIVSMCRSANPTAPAATCANSNIGWVSFRDLNGNCAHDAGEAVVSSGTFDHSFTAEPLTVKMNGDCVSFAPSGFTRTAPGVAMLDHI